MQYTEILSKKKEDYTEYRLLKSEVQEMLIAQRNIASLYNAECMTIEQKRRKEEQR